MPDRRQHRGPHPEDAALFGTPARVRTLRRAAGDLAWLLGRQYAPTAALTLVGNRYQLHTRHRQALARAVAAPVVARARRQRQVPATALAGQTVAVDGFNQLITVEVALAGGLLLRGHDGALRDLASVHGTYRTMTDTPRALEALGTVLAALHPQAVQIWLDAPVSNAGRLAQQMRALAATHAWPWQVALVPQVDTVLRQSSAIVTTSDSGILDAPVCWYDLAAAVVAQDVPMAWCLDLNVPPSPVEA
jgi:hypothetical protein